MSRPRTKRHLLVENALALDVKSFVGQLAQATEASVRITFQLFSGPSVEQTIALTSLPRVPFGGRRWYFICPGTGGRACRLYLPMHGQRFLSREAYGLRYRVEHLTAEDRDIERYFKLYTQISGQPPPFGSLSPPPFRRKGMHQQNYNSMTWQLLLLQEQILTRIDGWLNIDPGLSCRQRAGTR